MNQRQPELPWRTVSARRMELVIAAGAYLPRGELQVLKAIMEILNRDQLASAQFPIEIIVARTRLSRAQVYKLRASLVKNNLLKVEQQAGTFRGKGVRYWIDLVELERVAFGLSEPPETVPENAGQLSHHEAAAVSPGDDSCLAMRRELSHHETTEPEKREIVPLLQKVLNTPSPSLVVESPEGKWRELKKLLVEECQIGDPHGCIDQAIRNGCSPEDVFPLLDEVRKFPRRWKPWEIWNRIKNQFPGSDPVKGWPAGKVAKTPRSVTPSAREQPRSTEASPESRDAAERLAAMSDDEIAALVETADVGPWKRSQLVRYGRDSPLGKTILMGLLIDQEKTGAGV
ncbi:MAG: hypothetical protein ACKVT0_01885 [Planctomycetaceae bacterium]